MLIEEDIKLDFKDVLIRPKRSTLRSRKEVDLTRIYTFRHSQNKWEGIPIMASNMSTIGTFEMAKAFYHFKMFTCIHKHYSVLQWVEQTFDTNLIAPSIGANNQDLEKFIGLHKQLNFRFLCIDVANGYGEYLAEFITRVRKLFPDLTIIAGNVATAEMTEQLILSGADIVKVGIGSGSVCTTRIQTGVGYPQLSAVIECADAAHGLGGHIISDGGCTCPGDVAKAFGAGADFVMLGGMLAGHYECGTNEFYGMSSEKANDKFNGGLLDYRSAEGKEVELKERGPVALTIQDILGGLRSTCTYIGASNLKNVSKCTTFIRVTNQYNKMFE